jgi:5,10-methylenetetrahydromethanopterin reductase
MKSPQKMKCEQHSRRFPMLQFGINVMPEAPVTELVQFGKEAERIGLQRCSLMDEGLATRDVYIALALIARETQKVQLGTGITNPFTRHPGVTAAAIATLDELSGGRAFLGIGAGGSLTLDPLKIERVKPLKAVAEMIRSLRALFRGESVTFEGELVRFNHARLWYARPDLPIWIASRGEKMLALGGKLADGVSLDFVHRDLLGDYISIIREGAKQSGNQPRIQYATAIITNDAVLQRLRPYVTFSLVDSPPKAKELIGITPQEVDAIRQTMNREGLAAAGKLLKEEWIRPFVVMGSIEECAAQIRELYQRYRIDYFLLPLLDLESAPQMMADLAKVKALV